jgi:putative PIN family toxin of toxin-antitoxin system
MRIKVFAVLDTNVLVSSVLASGTPKRIIELIQANNIFPVFDKRMLKEYYFVLSDPKFHDKISKDDVFFTLYLVVSKGILVNNIKKTTEKFTDRSNIPFFEVMEDTKEFATNLVTGNRKHFPQDNPHIYTPQTFLGVLQGMEFYVSNNLIKPIDYDKAIQQIIETETNTEKYTSGSDLLSELFDMETKEIDNSYFLEDR